MVQQGFCFSASDRKIGPTSVVRLIKCDLSAVVRGGKKLSVLLPCRLAEEKEKKRASAIKQSMDP
jgi:hypothetical protein